MGGSGGAGSAHPLPAESALFPAESALFVEECNFQCFPLLLETPKKALVHCTKPKIFSRKKMLFLQLGKTWNLIPRCQENVY
jgi:hypothetical protein